MNQSTGKKALIILFLIASAIVNYGIISFITVYFLDTYIDRQSYTFKRIFIVAHVLLFMVFFTYLYRKIYAKWWDYKAHIRLLLVLSQTAMFISVFLIDSIGEWVVFVPYALIAMYFTLKLIAFPSSESKA